MPNKSNEDMRRATSLHQNGQLDQAEEIYKSVLINDPQQSDAQYLLGIISLNKGNYEVAIQLIDKAIIIDPTKAHYYNDCAQAYNALSNTENAINYYKKAITLNKDNIEAYNNIGNIFREIGEHGQAIIHLKKAIDLDSAFTEGHYNLALTYNKNKDYKNATFYYNKTIEIDPNFFAAYNNLGVIYKNNRDIKTAFQYFKKAISINPKYLDAYLNLGYTHFQYGNVDEAFQNFNIVLTIDPSYIKAYIGIAIVMRRLNKQDEAISQLKKALVIKPDDPYLLDAIGQTLTELGKKEEAIEYFENTIKIKPSSYETIHSLALINPESKYLTAIKKSLKDSNLNDNDKAHLHFSYGIISDKLKDFHSAFAEYKKANLIKRNEIPYKAGNDSAYVNKLTTTYTEEYVNKIKKYGVSSDLPIFIVGMPRSGTSLAEQILSSHNSIYGAGELNLIDKNIEGEILKKLNENNYNTKSIRNLSETTIKFILEDYLNELRKFSKTASHITDKLPYNYLKIGLIKSLLPNSKIIHCKRNALDTCLSIYFSNFPSIANDIPSSIPLHDALIEDEINNTHSHHINAFSYDLLDIGKKYLTYEEIMVHWKNIFPDDIYQLNYEELILDQEKISRELINHIGLEWDPECLNFYKNKREVKTTSYLQVRKPIYSSSVERWKEYRKFLKPLILLLKNTK